jgi:hypothetical protein
MELPSADLYTAIAREAGYSGVTVSSVDAAETPGTEEIGETMYSRSEVDLTLEGSLSQIRAFLSRMETGEFATLRFEDVNLTMVEETQTWEGQVTLVVLSQR